MQVILLERIGRLGQMGDVVTVKDGFARNFLLPQKKALRATDDNRKQFEVQRVQLEARNLELKREAEAVNTRLEGKSFTAIRTAGDTGQLYGSVSARDVADLVTEGGYTIERRMVSLDSPIKTLGLHTARVQLHPEVTSKITVNVARSAEEAERQTRGENLSVVKSEGVEIETFNADAMFEAPGTGDQPDV